MVKLPAKFDDISKTAKSVLEDDYTSKGYQLEAKQKTNLDSAVLTATVDFDQKGDVKLPAKLGWKFPKPFGIVGFAIDKFELDKSGGLKLEASMKKEMHKIDGLVLDCKSDCKDASKATASLAYTGIKDAFVKFETKPMNLNDFKAECLYGVGPVAFGAQFGGTDVGKANVGLNFAQGNFFASLIVKNPTGAAGSPREFIGHACFKPSSDILLSATCNYVNSFSYAFGGQTTVTEGVVAKAKIDVKKEKEAQAACKIDVTKGMKVILGGMYNIDSGSYTTGVKLAIE